MQHLNVYLIKTLKCVLIGVHFKWVYLYTRTMLFFNKITWVFLIYFEMLEQKVIFKNCIDLVKKKKKNVMEFNKC